MKPFYAIATTLLIATFLYVMTIIACSTPVIMVKGKPHRFDSVTKDTVKLPNIIVR